MQIRLIFGKEAYDHEVAWADLKTIIVEVPDELKDYHLLGGEAVNS